MEGEGEIYDHFKTLDPGTYNNCYIKTKVFKIYISQNSMLAAGEDIMNYPVAEKPTPRERTDSDERLRFSSVNTSGKKFVKPRIGSTKAETKL